jgi:glycosyl-4,4'-diaponeurosporenoate acyltransferase
MQVIYLSIQDTVLVDIFAWIFIHFSIGYWCSRIPVSKFNPQKWFYLTRPWEKGGEIYERFFHVRSWKKYIPAGGKLYSDTFSLQKLSSFKKDYLELWLKESCRAEFCHWIMVLPGFLFFFWNSTRGGCLMMIYAVLNNLFPIVLQRFNRPRIRRLMSHLNTQLPTQENHKNKEEKSYDQEKVLIPNC